MIGLRKAKWYVSRAVMTHSKDDWKKAFEGLNKSKARYLVTQSLVDLLNEAGGGYNVLPW